MDYKRYPIGIVKLYCDYDLYDAEYRSAYYEILSDKEQSRFINRFVFLDDDVATGEETFERDKMTFSIVSSKNSEIVIQILGNEIILNNKQLKHLEEVVAKVEE